MIRFSAGCDIIKVLQATSQQANKGDDFQVKRNLVTDHIVTLFAVVCITDRKIRRAYNTTEEHTF
jgi:hypothetical protein